MRRKRLASNHFRWTINTRRNNLLFVAVFCLFCSTVHALTIVPSEVGETQAAAIELAKVWELASVRRAIILYRKAADDWVATRKPHNAIFCLNEAAKITQPSEYDTTTEILEKAIHLADINGLNDEKVISLSLLSLRSLERGNRARALSSSQLAVELSNNSDSSEAISYALLSAGMYEYYYGNIRNASNFFEQSTVASRQTEDIWLKTNAALYAGFSNLRDAKPLEAETSIKAALSLSEEHQYRKGIAQSYAALAYVNFFVSEKQKALDLFERAEELLPADFEWIERARIRGLIGEIYLDHGYLDLAEINLRESVSYYEMADYPSGRAVALKYLAQVYLAKNDAGRSRETFGQALAVSEMLKDAYLQAEIKEGIGNVDLSRRDYDNAIKNYLNAFTTYKSVGVRIPNIEHLLGEAFENKGSNTEARRYYNSALATSEYTRNFMQMSGTLYNLARLDDAEHKHDEAFENIRRSVDLTEHFYSDVSNPNIKRSYLSSAFERFELYTKILMERSRTFGGRDFAIDAFRVSEKARSRSLLQTLQLSDAEFTADADSGILQREGEMRISLNAKTDNLTDLLAANGDKTEIDILTADINVLEHQLEQIKTELKQKSPVYSAIKDPPEFDLADFQANVLGENDVLLEYFLGKEESYLWLVAKDGFEAFVLPPRDTIEGKVDELRGLLDARKAVAGETLQQMRERIAEVDSRYPNTARELSDMILGPVAGKLTDKRLIVVPDGKLHYLAINALPLPKSGSDEPILLTNEVVYEPSAQTLSLLTTLRSGPNDDRSRDLLVFSDPVFSKDDARISTAGSEHDSSIMSLRFAESLEGLQRLPASGQEAEDIAGMVGGQTDRFTGFRATRDNLLAANLSDYKIIHLATHGLVNEERPELSAVVLSRFDEDGRPLNQSVRLQDIYAMKLNADLVVLSACQTASGKELKGEGVLGLNGAFLQAGARSVVASLWQVEDNATNLLMGEFYRGLADGQSVSTALRKAQLKLYRDPQFRSPFFWAAFTLQGDMNRRPDISSGLSRWWFTAIPILILAGIFLRRRIRPQSQTDIAPIK